MSRFSSRSHGWSSSSWVFTTPPKSQTAPYSSSGSRRRRPPGDAPLLELVTALRRQPRRRRRSTGRGSWMRARTCTCRVECYRAGSAARAVMPRPAERLLDGQRMPRPGRPSPTGRPSSSTTGMISRTDEDVNASSAAGHPLELVSGPPRPRSRAGSRRSQHLGARDAGEDAELERRRQQTVAASRHQTFVTGPSSTIPSVERKTASSAPRRRASASAAMLTA